MPTTSQPVTIPDEDTIDESILKTIWRDIASIGRNLKCVLVPVGWKFAKQDQALRNWDLWGPLVSRSTTWGTHGSPCARALTRMHGLQLCP